MQWSNVFGYDTVLLVGPSLLCGVQVFHVPPYFLYFSRFCQWHGLSPRRTGFIPWSVDVGFAVAKVALGQIFDRVLCSYSVTIIPPLLLAHSFTYHQVFDRVLWSYSVTIIPLLLLAHSFTYHQIFDRVLWSYSVTIFPPLLLAHSFTYHRRSIISAVESIVKKHI
jgi:hypothetical protein